MREKEREKINRSLQETLDYLEGERAFIAKCNIGTETMDEAERKVVRDRVKVMFDNIRANPEDMVEGQYGQMDRNYWKTKTSWELNPKSEIGNIIKGNFLDIFRQVPF